MVAYTLYGDTNLDGTVNGADLGDLAGNFNKPGTDYTWAQGDFNYDGVVNGIDLSLLAGNWDKTIGAGPEAVGIEPTFQQELAIVEAE